MALKVGTRFHLLHPRWGSQARGFEVQRMPKPIDGAWHYLIGAKFELLEADMQPISDPLPAGYVDVEPSGSFDGGQLIFDDACIGVVLEDLGSGRYLTVIYTGLISPTEL
jgi:hypothetical protein